jgi:DNA-directed RNA polymerase specialized sigma subunit
MLKEAYDAMMSQKEGAAQPAATPHSFPDTWKVPNSPKRQEELQLWRTWKEGGEKPEHLTSLIHSMQPLVNQAVSRYAGRVPIQREVLHAEATRHLIKGLRGYEPEKAGLSTHLTNQLQSLHRFVVQHQNVARITEVRAGKIGKYERAITDLNETLGRPPTTIEIADKMQVSQKTVTRLGLEIRKTTLASESGVEDPFLDEVPRAREVLRLIKYELTPQELLVFERLTGEGGHMKTLSTGQIAKQLKWSDSKVSQTKNSIMAKIKKYM